MHIPALIYAPRWGADFTRQESCKEDLALEPVLEVYPAFAVA